MTDADERAGVPIYSVAAELVSVRRLAVCAAEFDCIDAPCFQA